MTPLYTQTVLRYCRVTSSSLEITPCRYFFRFSYNANPAVVIPTPLPFNFVCSMNCHSVSLCTTQYQLFHPFKVYQLWGTVVSRNTPHLTHGCLRVRLCIVRLVLVVLWPSLTYSDIIRKILVPTSYCPSDLQYSPMPRHLLLDV